MARLILSTIAFAALAAAVPQHADHMAKAHVARSNQLFGRGHAVAPLAGRTLSYDGSCGSWSGYTCPGSSCCGPQGWCGTSETHCGTGCQAGFGSCGTAGTASTSPAPSEPAPAPEPASPAPPAPTTHVQGPSVASSSTTIFSSSTTLQASANSAVTPASEAEAEPAKAEGGQQQQQEQHHHKSSSAASTSTSSTSTAQAQSPSPKPENAPSPSPSPSPSAQSASASSVPESGSSGLGDTYTMYSGDGSTAAGWPSETEWVDFDSAFEANKKIMSNSCKQWNVPNDSDDEISSIKSGIKDVAQSTGVDARFILAILLQESNGCVRAPTTNYGVINPGLMQSHNGDGSCNRDGSIQTPCPQNEIELMIHDGTAGTSSGDGLQQTIAQAHSSDVSKYYKAARIYNSGSIAASGKLEDGIATHCYSSDIANRLTGWVSAPHGCNLQ